METKNVLSLKEQILKIYEQWGRGVGWGGGGEGPQKLSYFYENGILTSHMPKNIYS